MSDKKIAFILGETKSDLTEIYNFNVKVFADSPDFIWTEDNINKEIKNGWEIFSVKVNKDIICALFVKKDKDNLLTKNTPIKIDFQGQGFSHIIKDFYEDFAIKNKITKVYNYCPSDNFRMISLNEGHNYLKTGKVLGENNNMIEWKKTLKA